MSDGKISRIRMIEVSEFNDKWQKLVGNVARNGNEVVITEDKHPISLLVAAREKPKSLFAIDKEHFEILGDMISPVNVEWEAQIGRTEDGD